MSVSTEYFDFVFASKAEVADDIQASIEKLDRREEKLAELQSLVDEKASKKRLKRLAKWTALVEQQEAETDELIGRLNTLEAVELPKDEITYAIWNAGSGLTGIQVTVTDSPYDDTFVGGQRTKLTIDGIRPTAKGTESFFSRGTFIPASFEDGTETFFTASSTWSYALDGSYSEVNATIQGAVTPIVTDGEIVI